MVKHYHSIYIIDPEAIYIIDPGHCHSVYIVDPEAIYIIDPEALPFNLYYSF